MENGCFSFPVFILSFQPDRQGAARVSPGRLKEKKKKKPKKHTWNSLLKHRYVRESLPEWYHSCPKFSSGRWCWCGQSPPHQLCLGGINSHGTIAKWKTWWASDTTHQTLTVWWKYTHQPRWHNLQDGHDTHVGQKGREQAHSGYSGWRTCPLVTWALTSDQPPCGGLRGTGKGIKAGRKDAASSWHQAQGLRKNTAVWVWSPLTQDLAGARSCEGPEPDSSLVRLRVMMGT